MANTQDIQPLPYRVCQVESECLFEIQGDLLCPGEEALLHSVGGVWNDVRRTSGNALGCAYRDYTNKVWPLLGAFFRNWPYLMDSKSTLRALWNSARPSVVRLRALLLMVSLRDEIRGISASLSQRGSVAMSGWGRIGWALWLSHWCKWATRSWYVLCREWAAGGDCLV